MWQLALALFIIGVGISSSFNPLAALTLGTLSNKDMGNGSGLFNLMRNIGGSVGIAILTTVLAQYSPNPSSLPYSQFDAIQSTLSSSRAS